MKPQELRVLSPINLLGKVGCPKHFLFILDAIRQAVEEEGLLMKQLEAGLASEAGDVPQEIA